MKDERIQRAKQTQRLKELQKQLSQFRFDTNRPGPSFTELERGLIDGKSGRHVVYWGNASQLTATLFYGGAQFTIARRQGMTPEVVQSIGRIADAACCYFWKYRKRKAASTVPDQAQLNFPLQSAQEDLKNEPDLLNIFEQMEGELLALGYISLEPTITTAKMIQEKWGAQLQASVLQLQSQQSRIAEAFTRIQDLERLLQIEMARVDRLLTNSNNHKEPVIIPTAEGNIWSNK